MDIKEKQSLRRLSLLKNIIIVLSIQQKADLAAFLTSDCCYADYDGHLVTLTIIL